MTRSERAVPRATYRLQLTSAFGFEEAAAVVPYLRDLGVSDVYLSPALQAASGSEHGYDVADPSRMDQVRGGEEGFALLSRTVADAGLALVLDVVPNHMAAHPENPWWRDVLRHGRASAWAGHFDIDWDDPRNPGKVVLPILGEPLGDAVSGGAVRVVVEDGRLAVAAHETVLPLSEESERQARAGRAAEVAAAELEAREDAVRDLLERQHWRLAFWRRGLRRLTYRRFFDITDLVGVRVEDERVFRDRHARVLRALEEGPVRGLRVDHPDGLSDPEGYFERLRAAAPDAWIVVEKILEGDEELPPTWPVDGTTGYDFAARATRLFVDPAAEPALSDLHRRFTGCTRSFHEIAAQSKRLIVEEVLVPEMARLTRLLAGLAADQGVDAGEEAMRHALVELLVGMPVYRTYRRRGGGLSPADRASLGRALAQAREAGADTAVLALIERAVTGDLDGEPAFELASRLQQVTGPATAKGLEDTAFYRYHRLVCLNEVGADPACFSIDVGDFHAWCARLHERWPATMTAGTTHDTKRSADVRMRIAAISEQPRAWAEAVERWHTLAARHRRGRWPDPAIEYLLWQTVVGCWPAEAGRIAGYMEKASREAKEHTSWLDPDPEYDRALQEFVHAVLGDDGITTDVAAFVGGLLPRARVHALSLCLLQLTAPGVPDVYQGNELWDLSLTDPDNRRPVDFARRRELLAALRGLDPEAVLARADEGLPKLLVVHAALGARRRHPEAFGARGTYRPIETSGREAERVVAFCRGGRIATVVPRLTGGLDGGWADTAVSLPRGEWVSLFGDERCSGRVAVETLLRRFPLALLERTG